MKTPHLLLAASNPYKLVTNLSALLDAKSLQILNTEIETNCIQLVALGVDHYAHARGLPQTAWRHIISRLYYAAYTLTRAVRLLNAGEYNTDLTDHKKIGELPAGFPNRQQYANLLPTLRDDRNLCDYDHTVTKAELLNDIATSLVLVEDLQRDVKAFFAAKGIKLP